MQTKIEGLLISKIPYGERNIIGKVLLRNGKSISILFYGGQGGGKRMKPSTLELGYMLKIEIIAGKKTSSTLKKSKEWVNLWSHNEIRLNYEAFYLMCFYLEVIVKICTEEGDNQNIDDNDNDNDAETEGTFRVLSNAIFTLEKSLLEKEIHGENQLTLFLGKLLISQGVFPETNGCIVCGKKFIKDTSIILLLDQGGFACSACTDLDRSDHILLKILIEIAGTRYHDFCINDRSTRQQNNILFSYFCYQFHFEKKDFKSLSVISRNYL